MNQRTSGGDVRLRKMKPGGGTKNVAGPKLKTRPVSRDSTLLHGCRAVVGRNLVMGPETFETHFEKAGSPPPGMNLLARGPRLWVHATRGLKM